VTLSYAVDARLWGLSDKPAWTPTRFHLTNLAWHLVVVTLLFLLLRQLQWRPDDAGCPWVAGMAVALFALHPVLTESVAWISGRAELMAATFGLASLMGAVRYVRHPSVGAAGVAFGCFVLSLLCKESAIAIPVLAGVLCWWQGRTGTARVALVQGRLLAVGYMALALAYIVVRAWCFRDVDLANVAYADVNNTVLRWLTAGKVLAVYAWMSVVPYGQSVFHAVDATWLSGMLGTLALVALCVGLWTVRHRAAWLTLAGLWFFCALVPVSNLVVRIGSIMAERFLYLPVAGLAVGAGLGLTALNRCMPQAKWPFLLVAALAAFQAVRTHGRAGDWRDERALWSSAARVYPDSFVPQAQLGFALRDASQPDTALVHFERALLLIEKMPARTRQQFEPRILAAARQARRLTTASAPLDPDLESIHQLARTGQYQEAVRRYGQYLDAHPDDVPARSALADCYLRLRNFKQAADILARLTEQDPQKAIWHGKLGIALMGDGRSDEARLAYGQALVLNPGDEVTRANLAALEMKDGNWTDAALQWTRVLETRPDMIDARYNFAVCLYRLNDWQAALDEANTVLARQPNHADAARLVSLIRGVSRQPAP
jgi:tetratricopeptide (TPR) repeat protein